MPKSILYSITKEDENNNIPDLSTWIRNYKKNKLSKEDQSILIGYIKPPQIPLTLSSL